MKINVSDADEALGARGLTEDELKTLGEWRAKFESKYPRLGTFERRGDGELSREAARRARDVLASGCVYCN